MGHFIKYPKIRDVSILKTPNRKGYGTVKNFLNDPDDRLVIQEKIDGAQARFMVWHGKLVFGSRDRRLRRNQVKESRWRDFIDYITAKMSEVKLKRYEGLIFYGEACWEQRLNYDWDKMPLFIGYDIRKRNEPRPGEGWLAYPKNRVVFEGLDFRFVPVMGLLTSAELKEALKNTGTLTEDDVPDSKYRDGKAEGIVIKNYAKGMFLKYTATKWKENNWKYSGIPKAEASDGAEKVVAVHCTNRRIDKMVYKILEETGAELDMALMQFLPKRVLEDIYEENFKEIYYSNWVVDFKKLRQLVNQRCVWSLKQLLGDIHTIENRLAG